MKETSRLREIEMKEKRMNDHKIPKLCKDEFIKGKGLQKRESKKRKAKVSRNENKIQIPNEIQMKNEK